MNTFSWYPTTSATSWAYDDSSSEWYVSSTSATNNWKVQIRYVYDVSTTATTTATGWAVHSWTDGDYYHGLHDTSTTYHQYSIPESKENFLKRRLKEMIDARCAPKTITRKSIQTTEDIREQRARETLRRVIGEEKYLNFLKHGFVTAKAKSGRVYQIFPGYQTTKVYEKGKNIESLCIVLTGNFPPTDSLIMRYILVLNNEEKFRKMANISKSYDHKQERNVITKNLAEEYRELKLKIA